jgi:excinuclease ABC subunit C
VLRQNSPALLLLAAIRDEAHRFAIEYHRTLRSKEGIASGIEQIPGIGAKRRTALLTYFGSLQRLREAAIEEIQTVPGMTEPSARTLYETLHQEESARG